MRPGLGDLITQAHVYHTVSLGPWIKVVLGRALGSSTPVGGTCANPCQSESGTGSNWSTSDLALSKCNSLQLTDPEQKESPRSLGA